MGTKNYDQFMIFELPMYILHVPNFKPVAHEGQLPPLGQIWGSRGVNGTGLMQLTI